MNDLYSELAQTQLQQMNGSPQLVLVHPNYTAHRAMLDTLVSQSNTVYVRWDGDCMSTDALWTQFNNVLQEQIGTQALDSVNNLVLDECDRLTDEALDDFIESVSKAVVKENGGRVVVISRRVPRFLDGNFTERETCVFVPVDDELLLCDYLREGETPHLLEIHAFGSGRVRLNGREVNNWDGLLPRSLFFYLVDKGMTTRDDIFKIFWPNLTTKEATNVFHVTKRKISEVLGIDLTTYWSGFYRISSDIELSYDVMAFTKMVQDSAIAPADEAKALLNRAISLYRGPFLTSLDLEWTAQRRDALRQSYGEALVSLAKMSEAENDKREALGLYLRSAQTNPHREDLVYSIMSLYAELDMINDALLCYERLEHELTADLNLKPAPHLREFADELRGRRE